MSSAAESVHPPSFGNAQRCLRCARKGHTCYAAKVENGEPVCMYCLDGEPCFYEQRNKGSERSTPMEVQSIAAKANGHDAGKRLCKCGCGEVVPATNRFSYINGHRSRKTRRPGRCECGKPLHHRGRCKAAKAPRAKSSTFTPPVATRVSLEVTEAQLDHFLVRLPFPEKQRLANYYLESAEV